MLKISDYLRHAEECEALAKSARTPEEAEISATDGGAVAQARRS